MTKNDELLLKTISMALILNASLYLTIWAKAFFTGIIVSDSLTQKFITGIVLILLSFAFIQRKRYRHFTAGAASGLVATGLIGKMFHLNFCFSMGGWTSPMCTTPSYLTFITLLAVGIYLLRRNVVSFVILFTSIIVAIPGFLDANWRLGEDIYRYDIMLLMTQLMLLYLMSIDLRIQALSNIASLSTPGLIDFYRFISKIKSYV